MASDLLRVAHGCHATVGCRDAAHGGGGGDAARAHADRVRVRERSERSRERRRERRRKRKKEEAEEREEVGEERGDDTRAVSTVRSRQGSRVRQVCALYSNLQRGRVTPLGDVLCVSCACALGRPYRCLYAIPRYQFHGGNPISLYTTPHGL